MNKIEFGDFRKIGKQWVSDGVKVQMCVTSPPYFGLRDYGVDGQIGLEETPEKYVSEMVDTFRIVRDLLVDGGTLWLNLGDSYAGSGKGRLANGEHATNPKHKQSTNTGACLGKVPVLDFDGLKSKDLIGIPWRVAFALQADGWYLRQDIIWMKRNPMPESVRDRCTKSHEYLFLLSKSPKYHFNTEGIQEPSINAGTIVSLGESSFSLRQAKGANVKPSGNGNAETYTVKATRNKRSVWDVTTKPFKGAHFATFPPDLIEPCILAGSRPGDNVLDPFMGSGTTAGVAKKHGRGYLGCELNPEYGKLHETRIAKIVGSR